MSRRHLRCRCAAAFIAAALFLPPELARASMRPAAAGAEDDDLRAKLVFNTASRLYRQESWKEAAAAFGDFLAQFPRHADAGEARFARGYCLHRLGEHAKAAEELRLAAGDAKARWAGDAQFTLARSLDALAAAAGADGASARARRLEAAAAYEASARARQAELAAAATAPERRRELAELIIESAIARGEALYQAGAFAEAIQALAALAPAGARPPARAIYVLALAHYARARDAEAAGKAASYDEAMALLGRLAGKEHESEAFWDEAAFLLARLQHRAGRRGEAAALYERIARRGQSPRAAEAAYHHALAVQENGGPEALADAARRFAEFRKRHPQHPLALQAAFHEASCLFDARRYDEAAARFAEVLGAKPTPADPDDVLDRAQLRRGQALFLKSPADLRAAVAALTRATASLRDRAAAGKSGARELLAQAVFWQAEALSAQGGDALPTAAITFEEVAERFGDAAASLAEEALYKAALAHHRGRAHADCARCLARYRERFPQGRFRAEALGLAGRNALAAPAGAIPDAERDAAAAFLEGAARQTSDAAEARRLVFLAGVARYQRGEHAEAEELLEEADAGGAADAELAELPFYLADAIAQREKPGARAAGAAADAGRLARAAALFERYLAGAARAPQAPASRHAPAALLNLGLCKEWAGDAAGARKAYAAFVAAHPRHDAAARLRARLADLTLEAGDLEAAAALYRQAAAGAGDGEAALALRSRLQAAQIERRLGRAPAALALLDEALRLAAGDGEVEELRLEARFQRALALIDAGRAADAEKALEEFLREHPGSPRDAEARRRLAYQRLDQQRAAEAIEVLAPVLAAGAEAEGRDEALYLSGWASAQLAAKAAAGSPEAAGHRQEMEAQYGRLIVEHPTSPFAWDALLELGQDHFNRRSYGEAKRCFEDLLARLERAGAAAGERGGELRRRGEFGLAFVHYEERDFEAARARFDRVAAEEDGPLAARALFQAGRAWMESRGERQAAKRFEALIDSERAEARALREEALLRLAECRHRLQDYAAAVTTIEAMLAEFPEGALRHEARFTLGFALQYLERGEEAAAAFAKVVSGTRAAVAARAQYHIGECFMDRKDYARAAREFLAVAANFDLEGPYREWFRRALLAAGLAYQAAGDRQAAAKAWRELIERFPESEEGRAAKERLEEVKP
jgi:TolA-binding protein